MDTPFDKNGSFFGQRGVQKTTPPPAKNGSLFQKKTVSKNGRNPVSTLWGVALFSSLGLAPGSVLYRVPHVNHGPGRGCRRLVAAFLLGWETVFCQIWFRVPVTFGSPPPLKMDRFFEKSGTKNGRPPVPFLIPPLGIFWSRVSAKMGPPAWGAPVSSTNSSTKFWNFL